MSGYPSSICFHHWLPFIYHPDVQIVALTDDVSYWSNLQINRFMNLDTDYNIYTQTTSKLGVFPNK